MICRFERVLRDYTPCDSYQGFSAQDQYPTGPPPILQPILHSVWRHAIQSSDGSIPSCRYSLTS